MSQLTPITRIADPAFDLAAFPVQSDGPRCAAMGRASNET